jgi:hypothetical protein
MTSSTISGAAGPTLTSCFQCASFSAQSTSQTSLASLLRSVPWALTWRGWGASGFDRAHRCGAAKGFTRQLLSARNSPAAEAPPAPTHLLVARQRGVEVVAVEPAAGRRVLEPHALLLGHGLPRRTRLVLGFCETDGLREFALRCACSLEFPPPCNPLPTRRPRSRITRPTHRGAVHRPVALGVVLLQQRRHGLLAAAAAVGDVGRVEPVLAGLVRELDGAAAGDLCGAQE